MGNILSFLFRLVPAQIKTISINKHRPRPNKLLHFQMPHLSRDRHEINQRLIKWCFRFLSTGPSAAAASSREGVRKRGGILLIYCSHLARTTPFILAPAVLPVLRGVIKMVASGNCGGIVGKINKSIWLQFKLPQVLPERTQVQGRCRVST